LARPLPSDARWWRFPTAPSKPRKLDHTKLTGKNRAVYPWRSFTEAERRAYRLERHRGHYGAPYTRKAYPGEVFRGHRRIEQTTFTRRLIGTRRPKVQRWLGAWLRTRRGRSWVCLPRTPGPSTVCGEALKIVPIERIAPDHGLQTICLTGKHRAIKPSFRYCWLKMLPWNPDQSEFKAFIRAQSVHRTTRVIPSLADFRHS
jgi:hypothetical protein